MYRNYQVGILDRLGRNVQGLWRILPAGASEMIVKTCGTGASNSISGIAFSMSAIEKKSIGKPR